MTASFLVNLNPSSLLSSKPVKSAGISRPASRFRITRAGIVLVASLVCLSACASSPSTPPYPGRRSSSVTDNSAMGSTAREMRSAQSVLSSGNSILGTIGSIGRNISRLGR